MGVCPSWRSAVCPTILAAAKLDRQAALLSAQAAALVLADDDDDREIEMMRILDLVETLDLQIADLTVFGATLQDVSTIREIKTGFVDTLHRLNTLVDQRNAIEESLAIQMLEMVEGDVFFAQPLSGDIVGHRWYSAALNTTHALQAAASAEREAALQHAERLSIGSLRQLQDAVSRLDLAQQPQAERVQQRLLKWADAEHGIIAQRRQILELRAAIDGTLDRNRVLSDLLGAASTELFHAGQSVARASVEAAEERLSATQVTYAAVLATTALIMLLTFLYLREYVILRLRALQNAMAANMRARERPSRPAAAMRSRTWAATCASS